TGSGASRRVTTSRLGPGVVVMGRRPPLRRPGSGSLPATHRAEGGRVFELRRGWAWSWIAVASGLLWLFRAGALGLPVGVPVGAVGVILLSGGVTQLLWPGDRRATEWTALVGLVGGLAGLVGALLVGSFAALGLGASALAAAWAAGRIAVDLEPRHTDVPEPEPSLALSAKVALDDVLLGYELAIRGRMFTGGDVDRVVDELDRCHALFARQGFLERPDTYHVAPPPLVSPAIETRRIAGHAVEILRFESGYAPREDEPGRARWLAQAGCRDGFAYVLRGEGSPRSGEALRGGDGSREAEPSSRGPGRPWLVCTNGYRMGHAAIDVRVFERFATGLGLNVLIPVLPLHGPRRRSAHSGTGFLGLDVIDTLHAEAQAVWDIRRLLGWIRAQEPSAIGAFGLSLGGYTTALYSSIESGLDCAVLGIPLADVTRLMVRHAVPEQLQLALQRGYSLERAREVLRVVSPLAIPPRVPQAGRLLFGAVADRLVTPDQVRDLWRHWGEPEIVWYQGGHVTFRLERAVFAAIDRTLRANGVVGRENRERRPHAGAVAAGPGREERRA
ncbi:hypothetical protein K2X89_11120, partial [Myxococcota bacterium]|nr:hypothetical protein [Myxococcota bacterium]